MPQSSNTFIKKRVKMHRQWLIDNRHIVDMAFNFFEEELTRGTIEGLICISDSLSIAATYYGTEGAVQVVDNDADGWTAIHKAAAYRLRAMNIRTEAFLRTSFLKEFRTVPSLQNVSSIAACLLCYCTVFELEDWRVKALRSLSTIVHSGDAIDDSYWSQRVFEPFVLRLHQQLLTIDLPNELVQRDLGIYGQVFEHWNDVNRLEGVLFDLCEYHCRNMEDKGGKWDPEFKRAPFDLFAIEILAINKIREQLGVESVKCNHPLQSSPLSSSLCRQAEECDEILRRVDAVI